MTTTSICFMQRRENGYSVRQPIGYNSAVRGETRANYRHHRAGRSYLAELLLEKGYEVFGMVRRSSAPESLGASSTCWIASR